MKLSAISTKPPNYWSNKIRSYISLENIKQAFKDGADIEHRPTCGRVEDWKDCKDPSWNRQLYYYRIKFTSQQNINYLYKRFKNNHKSKSSQEFILIEKMKSEIERLKKEGIDEAK